MQPSNYTAPGHEFAVENDVTPPETIPHGTDEEIRAKLTPLKTWNWRMEGPGVLIADTEFGRLQQSIDNSYICLGTDKNNRPILKKIDV